jgi:hypothetical protein
MRAHLALLAALLSTTALAQTRQPANVSTIPSSTPQEFDILDNTGAWLPFGTASGGVFFPPGPLIDVRTRGAKCDGTTDDHDAIQAALNAGPTFLPTARCRTTSMIRVPDYGLFAGASFAPGWQGAAGSVLLCDATISGPCVIGGAGGTNKPFAVRDLVIARGAGTVPSDGQCFLEVGQAYSNVSNVECYNHAQGFEARSSGLSGGIANYFSNIHTCQISDAHFIVNAVPQVFVDNHSYFGCNGAFDLNANAYVRITGDWDNAKGGIHFLEAQFNQGQNRVACAFSFENLTGTGIVANLELIGGHVEVAQKGFCSDSTVKQLQYLQVVGLTMFGGWGGANSLFNFDPATQIYFWTLTGNSFSNWASATLAPSTTMDAPTINGNVFAATPMSITFPANSSITMEGNSYSGLTLTGTVGAPSKIGGSTRPSPNPYVYTGLGGQIEISIPGHGDIPCTIGLTFGGGSTGMTTSSTTCGWQMRGSLVTVSYSMFLTAKGSSTGPAVLTGLPLTSAATASTLNPMNYANLANACVTAIPNCGVFASVRVSDTAANLGSWGAGNMISLTDANFTNTSNLQGSITYVWGGGP